MMARTAELALAAWLVAAFLLTAPWANANLIASWNVPGFWDNHTFWLAARGTLYTGRLGDAAYLYSPVFAQLLSPFGVLPWEWFRLAWIGISWAVMTWLVWPLPPLVRIVALPLTFVMTLTATADVIVALVVALGLRYPAVWSAVLLTKILPGVCLLWFAVRREWRSLGIALGTTAVIAGLSFALAPSLWFDWLGVLARSSGVHNVGAILDIPTPVLPLRFAIAVLLVVWGARTDRRWTLALAATVANADVWTMTFVVLFAIPRLYQPPGSLR